MPTKAITILAALAASGNAGAGALLASGTILVDTSADAASPSTCSLRSAIALLNGTGDPGGCIATGSASPPEIRFDLALPATLVAGNEASKASKASKASGSFLAFGGGVHLSGFGAQHLIERSRIEGNVVGSTTPGSLPGAGGGLYVRQGISARVVDSTISGNAARGAFLRTGFNPDGGGLGGQGGGVFVDGGTLTMLRSAITDNTASFQGGGLHSYGTVRLANGSVLRNSIDGGDTVDEGGGLFQAAVNGGGFDVAMHLVHATVAGNSAARGAGLLVEREAPAATVVDNSVLDHAAGGDIFLSGSGNLSASHSLVAGMTDTGGLIDGVDGNQVGANPMLEATGDTHGGLTEVLRVMEGSPLVDGGDPALSVEPGGAALATDQRGLAFVPRVSGTAPDIGAFEYAGGLLFRDGMEPSAL